MAYCTVDEVRTITGILPKHLRLQENDNTGLNSILAGWIEYSKSLIDSFCNTTFDDNTPPAISSVCLRLTANMVAFSQTRKDTPIIKVNDWKVQVADVQIFTDDLRKELKPFKVDKSNKSDSIDIFAITGGD